MTTLRNYSRLLRISQWYKNLIVFLPLTFTQTYAPTELLIAFLGFSMASSITYIINDWTDQEADRLHPTKCHRPLASGKISGKAAIITSLVLAGITILTMITLSSFFASLVISYILITNAYSFGLKNIPILDITIIALNFVLRMMAGTLKLPTLETLPYFLLLFGLIIILVTHKRRADIKFLGTKKAASHKPVLAFYTRPRNYLIRLIGFLISTAAFTLLYQAGLPLLNIAALLTLLATTSYFFSLDPLKVMKPQKLFKIWEWDLCLLANILILVIL